MYLFLYFLRGVILSLKFRHNLLWLPLFFIAVTFACVLPVWLIWDTARNLIVKMGGDETMQWIFAIAFFIYIYMRYNFLKNIAPVFAFPAYHAGFYITNSLFLKYLLLKQQNQRKLSENFVAVKNFYLCHISQHDAIASNSSIIKKSFITSFLASL